MINGHRYYTKHEAAELARRSVRTVERAVRHGHLKATGVGHGMVIRDDWLIAWIEDDDLRTGPADDQPTDDQ